MPTPLFNVNSHNLDKLSSGNGAVGEFFGGAQDEIITTMNKVAVLALEAFRSTVPYRSGFLRDAIQLKEASISDPHAQVYINDAVHVAEGDARKIGAASNGGKKKPPQDQKSLEAFRKKAAEDYDRQKKAELTARTKSKNAGTQRTRKRIQISAGAHLLTNIELAFLLESGGSLSKRSIRRKGLTQKIITTSLVGATRSFVEFGTSQLSAADAIKQLEESFKRRSGRSFNQTVQDKAIERLADTRKEIDSIKTRSIGKKKSNIQQKLEEIDDILSGHEDALEKAYAKLQSARKHNDKEQTKASGTKYKIAQAQFKEASDENAVAEKTHLKEKALLESQLNILTKSPSKYSTKDLDKKEEHYKKSLEEEKVKVKEELLEPFKYSPHKHDDKEHKISIAELKRVAASRPEGGFTSPGAKTPTAKWLEEAESQFTPRIEETLAGLKDEITTSINEDIQELQHSILDVSKKAGITLGRVTR